MIFHPKIATEELLLKIVKSITEGTFKEQNGMTVVSWSSENTTVNKSYPVSPVRLLEECYMCLSLINPDKYGRRVTRTRPNFYNVY